MYKMYKNVLSKRSQFEMYRQIRLFPLNILPRPMDFLNPIKFNNLTIYKKMAYWFERAQNSEELGKNVCTKLMKTNAA